jgi:hypothetical protein
VATIDRSAGIRPLSAGLRGFLYVAAGLVFSIGIPLNFLTEATDRSFAWTIQPPLTAAFLGAAYWAAALLEILAARRRTWAGGRIALPAVFVFTTLTLVASLLHLDRFHLAATEPAALLVTWIWLAVYAVVPPLMIGLTLRQWRRPGADPPRDRPLTPGIRLAAGAAALLLLGFGLGLFVAPGALLGLWPWPLTPLTARAVAAWLVGLGLAAGHAAWENDVDRGRPVFVTVPLFCLLEAVALARYPGTIDWSRPHGWLYLAALAGLLLIGLVALRRDRRQPA